MKRPQIKMRIVNWWLPDTEKNFYDNYFVKILSQKYDIVYADKPDFLLFSQIDNYEMKTHFFDYDCGRIFFTGENIRTDWNLADYGIDFDYMEFGDRHLHLPLFVLGDIKQNRVLNKRDKFCAYIVTNGGNRNNALLREQFFDRLSEYKKVDSGGRHRNNIGHFVADKHKWLQDYKFNLCFENSSYPGYLTEKLFDAYNAGCVPIYWGDTSLRVGLAENTAGGGGFNPNDFESIDMRIPNIATNLIEYKINPKAFINAHNFPNLNALLEEVKRIDNDDKAYEAMTNEPLFLDNFNPKEFYEKKILDFFDNIFLQGANLAFRRGKGRHLNAHNARIKLTHLTRDALNVAKFISKAQIKIKRVLKFHKKS